jgi:hypothetical protein
MMRTSCSSFLAPVSPLTVRTIPKDTDGPCLYPCCLPLPYSVDMVFNGELQPGMQTLQHAHPTTYLLIWPLLWTHLCLCHASNTCHVGCSIPATCTTNTAAHASCALMFHATPV